MITRYFVYNTILTHIYEHYLGISGRRGTRGRLNPERLVLDILSRQDGQGCRKAACPPEKSFALLERAGYDLQEQGVMQRAGYDLQEQGEIQ